MFTSQFCCSHLLFIFRSLFILLVNTFTDDFSRNFDKSNGRAFMKDGDIFYSPNCAREVDVPQPLPFGGNPLYPELQRNGRHNLWDLDVSMYKQPAWWTIQFGWLAFFQTSDAQLKFRLFSALDSALTHHCLAGESGYELPPRDMNRWHCIDTQLSRASRLLLDHYGLYAMLPFEPWQFGYLRSHPRHGSLMVCLEKARRWFHVCTARLSYLVAGCSCRDPRSAI